MRMRCVLPLAALCLAAAGACRRATHGDAAAEPTKPVRVREVRRPMGTYMAITVYARNEGTGRKAIEAAFKRVEQVEAAISTWRSDSDSARLHDEAGGARLQVSPHLLAVLTRAVEVSRETDGAFDITVGPLIKLYRRSFRRRMLPPEDELAAARAKVGYQGIEVDAKHGTARLAKAGMRVDFGAIGKGYIVDQALAALRELGIEAALVDAGGDLYALGSPPDREGWRIGVRDPAHPTEILDRPLLARDCAVATSGDYEQFADIGGRRYSRIVDPRTGRPVEHMSSVTVIARDATTADAYATACSVLGPKDAVAFAEKRPGVEVLLMYRDGAVLRSAKSSGFARYIAPATPAP